MCFGVLGHGGMGIGEINVRRLTQSPTGTQDGIT